MSQAGRHTRTVQLETPDQGDRLLSVCSSPPPPEDAYDSGSSGDELIARGQPADRRDAPADATAASSDEERDDSEQPAELAIQCCGMEFKGLARFLLGVLVLLVVDVIWVASAAATKYLYDDDNYQKPLFTLYFKTSLFSLYLLGIPFVPSWRAMATGKVWKPADEDDASPDDDDDGADGSVADTLDDDRLLSHASALANDDDVFDEEEEEPTLEDSSRTFPAAVPQPQSNSAQRELHSRKDSPLRPALEPKKRSVSTGLPPILAEDSEDTPPIPADGGSGSQCVGLEESGADTVDRRFSASTSYSVRVRPPMHRYSSTGSLGLNRQSTISLTSVTSTTSLRSCLKQSASNGSLINITPVPSSRRRPCLSEPRYRPMSVGQVTDGPADDVIVEVAEIPVGSGSSCVMKARRDSKVHFRVSQEIRVMPREEHRDAQFARLSYESAEGVRRKVKESAGRLTLKETAKLAVIFLFLWFIANYFYQLAFIRSSVATVNILSSSSTLFVLVLGAVIPSAREDAFSPTKLCIVIVCCTGVGLVGYSESSTKANDESKAGVHLNLGVVYSLLGSLFYSLYIVILKRRVRNLERLVVPIFFGCVGAWCLLCLWPLLFIFHYTGVERFEWPQDLNLTTVNGTTPANNVWIVLAINGLIGTVLSEVLWLMGVFLTSPLVGTLALVLVNPLSLLYTIVVKNVSFSTLYIAGSVVVTVSFAIAAWLGSRNKDPVGRALRAVWHLVGQRCGRCRRRRLSLDFRAA